MKRLSSLPKETIKNDMLHFDLFYNKAPHVLETIQNDGISLFETVTPSIAEGQTVVLFTQRKQEKDGQEVNVITDIKHQVITADMLPKIVVR